MDEELRKFIAFRTYPKRYAILLLFGVTNFVLYYQHLQFSCVGNLVTEYYEQSYVAVDTTALVCNVLSIFLFYPIGRYVQKYGVRSSMIFATFVNAIGACVKCFAFSRNSFWLLSIGQFFPAAVTLMVSTALPVFGASWFKPNEVGHVFGTFTAFLALGISAAFLSPLVLFKDDRIGAVRNGLIINSIGVAILSAICFLLALCIVTDTPPTPPSLAEQKKTTQKSPPFKSLFTRANVLLLFLSTFLMNGICQTMTIIFNQSVLYYYKEPSVVSIAGVFLVVSGLPGSFVGGQLCKKIPKYKLLHVSCSALFVILVMLYVLSLRLVNVPFLLCIAFALGFLETTVGVVLSDYLIECTYPCPESMVYGFSLTISLFPAVILVPLVAQLTTLYGAVVGNTIFVGITVLNLVVSFLVKEDLRRRNANNECTPLIP